MRVLSALAAAIVAVEGAKLVRPPWGITVYTKVSTTNLRSVSAATSSFIFDGTIQYAWRDDSLFDIADDATTYDSLLGTNSKFYPKAGVPGKDPFPMVTTSVQNQLSGSAVSSFVVNYGVPDFVAELPPNDTSTWVVGKVVYTGLTVIQPQQLQNFPLDTQIISLNLINSNVRATDMRFHMVRETAAAFPGSTISPPTSPDGYSLRDTGFVLGNTTDGFPSLSVQWKLQRIPDFFLNRFVLPLSLIAIMLTSLMSANPSARVMAGFTMFGTVVSFLFVSSQSVPQLPYATRLDKFFTLNFFYACLIGLANAYSHNRTDRTKQHSIFSLLPFLAKAPPAAPAKKDDDAGKKEEAKKEEVALAVKAPLEAMDSTMVLRAMLQRELDADATAKAKAAADKKKSDEEKMRGVSEADKAAAQLLLDFWVAASLITAYIIAVPCIFYA